MGSTIEAASETIAPPMPATQSAEHDLMVPPVHPLLAVVFAGLDAAGVQWCLLRGETELEAPAGDVDLLVAPSDLGRTRQLLAALRFVEVPAWGHGSHRFFLSYHRATDRWIELDLVTELAFGRHFALQTHLEMGCLERRWRVGPGCVLAPDDAFWTLLLHCLLDKEDVPQHRAARLQELAGVARTDGALGQLVGSLCPGEWDATHLVECARRGDWVALVRIIPHLALAWRRRGPAGVWRRRLARAVLRRLDRLPMVKRRGLSVALLGPDGAGKSTLAAGVQRSFYLPSRTVYMGLWQGDAADARMARWRVPGFDLGRRLLTAWWRWLAAQYHRAVGRLVIFDRYTYDALLSQQEQIGRCNRAYFWLLAHACPAPDLVLVLDAPGAVMHGRKGEYTPEHLDAERQRFLALRQRLPQMQVVDVTRGPESVRADAVDRIWRRYAARQHL